jgi:putative membrane protein insertion efficiency factor
MDKFAATVALALLRGYQSVISPLLHLLSGAGMGCRFSPTCSEYARQAILRHGFRRGTGLAFKRVCRCHPWHDGGVDEVPD